MDLGSPENGLEELDDLLKEDESSLAGELGLNFVVNKEENAADYAFDNSASSNDFGVDVIKHGQQNPPSIPNDFPYYEFCGSPEKFHSPLQTGFDSVVLGETKFVSDEKRLQSPPEDYYHQEENEELCGSYFSIPPFQFESENLHDGIEDEVSEYLMESASRKDANQEEEMENRPASPTHEGMVQGSLFNKSKYEFSTSEFAYKEVEEDVSDLPAKNIHFSLSSHMGNGESESEHIHYSRNSPDESRKLEMPHSDQFSPKRSPQVSKTPGGVRQMAVTPDLSPCAYLSPGSPKTIASQQGLQDVSYSSRSHRKKHRFSPESSDLGIEVTTKLRSRPYGQKNSASPRGSRQGARHMDGSAKNLSASPSNHHSHQNYRGRDRSVSKSPVRRNETSAGRKREHHERSRSRSPYKRDYHRSSSRRRYSPRHRPPPSDYRSYRRSPRRRPWSPPHNRKTGLGKPGRHLFVAGFSFLTTERDLERKFSRFGRVRDVRIVHDKRSGDSRGFGFLSLERDEEADAAIRALDRTEWHGRIVLVEKSKSH